MAFFYEIHLRNKAGTFLEILEGDVFSLDWKYNTVGGCADCQIALRREFDSYGDIDLDYDVQIWRIPDKIFKAGAPPEFTGTELRYGGLIREIIPVFDDRESVRLNVSGYARQTEYIAIPDQLFANQDVGAIARDLIDTWILPGTKIKRTPALNLVQDTGISISVTGLRFDTSAFEALRTLGEIGGNVEWGVRADKEIYFLPRTSAVKQTFILGDRISLYESSKSSDEIVNWVYLRGGGGFTATLQKSSYETGFQKERVIFQPSIQAVADATLWGNAFFARFGQPQQRGRCVIGAGSDWIENVGHPLGKIRLLGGPIFVSSGARFPLTLPFRLAGNVGGTTDISYRINSISYRPRESGLTTEVELGEKSSALADLFRTIEFKLSELRQGL